MTLLVTYNSTAVDRAHVIDLSSTEPHVRGSVAPVRAFFLQLRHCSKTRTCDLRTQKEERRFGVPRNNSPGSEEMAHTESVTEHAQANVHSFEQIESTRCCCQCVVKK